MSRYGPRIMLIGGTYRALCALERMLERGEHVVAFIGQEGGGERDFCPEILEICDRSSIPARSGRKFGEEIVRWIEDRIRPDLAISIGVNTEVPLAIGGNCRLGLIEVIDFFHAEACPGIVLRQRGQNIMTRELDPPDESEEAGDAYLRTVEEMLDVLDDYLDQLEVSCKSPRITVPFGDAPLSAAEMELIVENPGAGKKTRQLEDEAAAYLEATRVIALTSPTLAFQHLIGALGLGEGDEVICPGLISGAVMGALRKLGTRPVLAEVMPECLTLDPDAVRASITPRTRALVISHPFGQPAELDRLYEIAESEELEVIEDAGTGLGARFGESRIGRSPCATLFQLPLGAGGGSASAVLVALPDQLADRFETSTREIRLGEGAAEIARLRLQRWDEVLATRREIAGKYSAEFVRYDAFRVPRTPANRLPVYASYVLQITQFARTTAEDLHKLLSENGIETRRLEIMAGERELGDLPITDHARASAIVLPVHDQLTDSAVERILDSLFDYTIG